MIDVAPSANGTQAWLYGLGGVALVAGLITLGMLIPTLRATQIGGTQLFVPAGLRSGRAIALAQISGVGLVFESGTLGSRMPIAWMSCVWVDGEGRIPLRALTYVPLVTRSSPGHRRRTSLTTNPWDVDPFSVTDIAVAWQSTAGKAAADIYRRVSANQGPNGPLLTQHAEKHDTFSIWDVPLITAYCSPDGDQGCYERRDPPKGDWGDEES